MLICRDCGAMFEEPKEYREKHGLDTPPYEDFYGCPLCGGSYNGTFVCNECGKYIFGDYVELKNGEYYCSDCFKEFNVLD